MVNFKLFVALQISQSLNPRISFGLALAIATALHHQLSTLKQDLCFKHHRLCLKLLAPALSCNFLHLCLRTHFKQRSKFVVAATPDDELLFWFLVHVFRVFSNIEDEWAKQLFVNSVNSCHSAILVHSA